MRDTLYNYNYRLVFILYSKIYKNIKLSLWEFFLNINISGNICNL